MESANFEQSCADPCLFIRSKGADLAIIAVYVDDLIIVAKSQEVMSKIKCDLSSQFNLGKIHYCLGITIDHDQQKGWLLMHQRQYIHKLLEKYGLSEAKPSTTPSDVSVKLIKDNGVSRLTKSITSQWLVASYCNKTLYFSHSGSCIKVQLLSY